MINYQDYPGTIPRRKKEPSPAQIKQWHKWMLTGTLAGMEARLWQLRADPMIPHGRLKSKLTNAWMSIHLAKKYLKETKMYLEFIPEQVTCPSCSWFGMSDDCKYNKCPNCGQRVILERKEI